MKLLIIMTVTFLSGFIVQPNLKLKGTYKVSYDKGLQGYQIEFNDSVYIKRMPDAVTYKGTVSYGKYKIIIRQNAQDNPIEIDNRSVEKDTLLFITKSKSDLSLNMNRGKMIKMK